MAASEKRAGNLGIEGGGTKTTWAVVAPDGQVRARGEAGPGNTLLLDEAAEQKRVEFALRSTWPRAAVVRVMEDTRSLLAAAFGDGPGIVVIAGTGSNIAGQRSLATAIEKAGGWGHLFADRGSAYDLARRGLEEVFTRYDADRRITVLAREYLAATGASTLEELVPFLLRDTSKTAVAQLAKCVFSAAQKGDRSARTLLDGAVGALAEKVVAVARRLRISAPRVALAGGLFENQPDYRARFQRTLRRAFPAAKAFLCDTPGVLGAARVAGAHLGGSGKAGPAPEVKPLPEPAVAASLRPIAEPARLAAFSAASTEQSPVARPRSPHHPATRRPLHPRGAPCRACALCAAPRHCPCRRARGTPTPCGRTPYLYGCRHQRTPRRGRCE
jgi:N-acetylglucosamine kinase-like BadF-type ATPase